MQTIYKNNCGLSASIASYAHSLKIAKKNEVYELLFLMLLNDTFRKELNQIIDINIKKIKEIGNRVEMKICSSRDYEEAVNLVCCSKYFNNTFTKTEIERKRLLALNMLVEIVTQSTINSWLSNKKVIMTFPKINFPTINHEMISTSTIPKIKLTFDIDTPLDDIVRYLKDFLEIKNKPRKKKLSLGQGFRILYLEAELRNRASLDKYEKYEYFEQLIAREMKNRYKENISTDMISKSLQRIKKIKKDLETAQDQ